MAPINVLADIPDRPTTAGFVFDYQHVIDDEVEKEINAIAEQLNEQDKMQLFVLTVPSIGSLEPFEYGVQVIRQWGIGKKETNNGMLIFVTTDQGAGKNVVRIATGQGLEGKYPDGKTGRLQDEHMVPYLIEGDYTSAFANVVDAIRIEEEIDYTWATTDVVENTEAEMGEEDIGPLTFGDYLFLFGLLLVLILVIWVAWKILEFIIVELFNGDDSPKNPGSTSTNHTVYYYDQSSDNDSNHDSFSGGGGDSAGGGSDRNF